MSPGGSLFKSQILLVFGVVKGHLRSLSISRGEKHLNRTIVLLISMKSLKQIVRGIWKRVKELGRKAATMLHTVITLVIALIVLVIIGVFICFSIEDVMTNIGNFTSSTWYSIYSDFVNTVSNAFPLLAVTVLVMIAVFIVGYIVRMLGGT